jgi:hypothetical protein
LRMVKTVSSWKNLRIKSKTKSLITPRTTDVPHWTLSP